MADTAKIAVLIAAHNAEKHLASTATNVFQSNVPVHLFLVDDASKVPVQDYILPDPRITILRSDQNIGLARALNLGLAEIFKQDFDFIARLDADDLSVPERLAKQAAYLDAQPDIGLVGSWLRFIDENTGKPLRYFQAPEHHDEIIRRLPINSCILHPSWMIRTAMAKAIAPYSTEFPAAEDYEFLMRAMKQGFRFAVLPEYLVDARDTLMGVSRKRRRQQLQDRLNIQLRYFNFSNPASYLGTLKTILLLCIPYNWIIALKNHFYAAD